MCCEGPDENTHRSVPFPSSVTASPRHLPPGEGIIKNQKGTEIMGFFDKLKKISIFSSLAHLGSELNDDFYD